MKLNNVSAFRLMVKQRVVHHIQYQVQKQLNAVLKVCVFDFWISPTAPVYTANKCKVNAAFNQFFYIFCFHVFFFFMSFFFNPKGKYFFSPVTTILKQIYESIESGRIQRLKDYACVAIIF